MNKGQLISKLVQSEGKVHNLKRELKELTAELKSIKEQLSLYDVMSSKILIEKNDLLELITKAIKEEYNTYEVVEAGLESFDAKQLANYIINKYV